jgi:Na+/proline symporter
MEIKQNFDVIDYLVFCSVILITILIGFYHGYKNQILQILNSKIYKNEMLYFLKKSENNQNKTLEYLNGNSNMSVFPISMSLLGTCFSATALVGN